MAVTIANELNRLADEVLAFAREHSPRIQWTTGVEIITDDEIDRHQYGIVTLAGTVTINGAEAVVQVAIEPRTWQAMSEARHVLMFDKVRDSVANWLAGKIWN